MPFANDGAEGGAVRGVFRDRLAEGERGGDGLVDGEGKVMGGDGSAYVGREGLDLCRENQKVRLMRERDGDELWSERETYTFNSGGSGAML